MKRVLKLFISYVVDLFLSFFSSLPSYPGLVMRDLFSLTPGFVLRHRPIGFHQMLELNNRHKTWAVCSSLASLSFCGCWEGSVTKDAWPPWIAAYSHKCFVYCAHPCCSSYRPRTALPGLSIVLSPICILGLGIWNTCMFFLKLLFLARKYTHTHTHITVFNQSHMCDKLKRCFMVRDGVARIVSRVAEVTCTATPLPGSKHCHGNQTSVRKSANIKVSLPEWENEFSKRDKKKNGFTLKKVHVNYTCF